MARIFYLFLVFNLFSHITSAKNVDSLYRQLDYHISNRSEYRLAKESAIKILKRSLDSAKHPEKGNLLYDVYSELAQEYDAYNYDSAIHYSTKRINLAYQLNDPSKIALSKSETGNILTRRGHYKEAIDTLLSVRATALSLLNRQKHYGFAARAYYSIADYNQDAIFSPEYRKIAEKYVDSIQLISTKENYYVLWHQGIKYLARYDLNKAVVYFERILTEIDVNLSQKAAVHSALGYIYREYNQPEHAKYHAINSAICDLQTNTRESMALTSLAEQLYEEGDISRAYCYILIAKEDADIYGAKLRQLTISGLMPKIEAEQLKMIEKKRKRMLQSVFVIGSVLLIIATLAFISFRQLVRLRKVRKVILEKNNELITLTEHLQEANKIKTEYIGYYFNFSTRYIDKLEVTKNVIQIFLQNRNLDGIKRSVSSINPKEERELLFRNFDSYFLHIFPEFIHEFNQLLQPDAQITIPEENKLNNDLRIFALIRLGIKDNEKIAKILGFSVNTIYTYKTKIKKKAIVPSNEFEERIKEIKSV